MKYIFWTSICLLFWSYLGYPFFIKLLAKLKKCDIKSDSNFKPTVSLIIAAYNEEKVIKSKIENSFELYYPLEKLQIIIVSDGSTDQTASIVRAFDNKGLLFIEVPRGGKAAALNAAVKGAIGEILVFSDANSILGKESLGNVARYFSDPLVGCVSGVKMITADSHVVGTGEGFYWKWETDMKYHESICSSAVGADGAFYAIRKELFNPPITHKNITDDLAISLSVWKNRLRIVLDKNTIAREEASQTSKNEFSRKVRIAEGAYRTLSTNLWLLSFTKNIYIFQFISHKVLRWFGPVFMLSVLVASFYLLHQMLFRILFLLQVAFYLMALTYCVFPLKNKLFKLTHHFIMTNAAQFWALIIFIFAPRPPYWESRKG